VLGALVAARDPVPLQVMRKAFLERVRQNGRKSVRAGEQQDMADNLVDGAKNLLFLAQDNSLRFVHKCMPDWLVRASTANELRINTRDGHEVLAELCRNDTSPFALGNLLYHHVRADMFDEASGLLCDLSWLLCALVKGHVPSSRLVLDAEPFLDKLSTDAALAVRALEKAGNALAHDPRELAGQMLARLDERHPLHEQAKGDRGASWLRPVGGINTLMRADDPLRKILQGHTGLVVSVALQGNTVVSGSDDKTVRVWDLQTGKQLQLLQGHTGWVTSVAMQGNTVVSGSCDNTVRVWDLRSSSSCKGTLGGSCRSRCKATPW
jgi:hypothetical protein